MKTFTRLAWIIVLGLALPVGAQLTTAFTYQGRLNDNGKLASGNYDFTFALFTTNVGGSQFGGPLTNVSLTVSNGLFLAILDFGNGVYTGTNLWLELGVRTNGANNFTPLTPRQPLTPTPYATYAATAGTVPNGSIGAAQIAPGAIGPVQLAIGTGGGSLTFTNSGTFTAPSNISMVFVTLIGGGGGGGAGDQVIGIDNYGGGGGGSGGIVVDCPVWVVPGAPYAVTVAEGGAGAPAGQTGGSPPWSGHDGSAGGTTSFSNRVFAYGGAGGQGALGINEGGGGNGGGGGGTSVPAPFNMGFSGTTGGSRGGNGSYVGGAGASSPFSSGGGGANGANGNGANATGIGSGGGGGAPSNNSNGKGGYGSAGVAVIRY